MTLFSSLAARRLALFAIVFVFGVACAQVDRGYYDDDGSAAGADNGGVAGTSGSGTGGKGGSPAGGEAGSAGEAGNAGELGEGGWGGGGGSGPSPSLSVVLAGDGQGTVRSTPAGINCGSLCWVEFDEGTEVVLTATASANSVFRGWSGGGCTGTGTCTVTTSTNEAEITATFTALPALSVKLAGNGAGVVKSLPAGIDCGSTCSMPVSSGSSVQLDATPATGSVFTGWSGGGCTGTGPCTTSVSAATIVTATFTLNTQTLTVVKMGTGQGTVTSVPAGITCGTDCSETVNSGTMLTLTAAVTGTGSVFSGWSGGGCSGTGACVVTVAAATQVTAAFTCSAGSVQLTYSGAITTFSVPSCVTSLTIDAYGAQGGSSTVAYPGGYGARIKGTIAVPAGTNLKVLVGGKGIDAFDTLQQGGGSGGGGTFVTTLGNSPIMVAGGGGGAINNTVGGWYGAGLGGTTTNAGLADGSGTGLGGINGNGGVTGNNTAYHSGTGGGGLLGDGVGNSLGNYGSAYSPGLAFVNGGIGGIPGSCGSNASCLVGRNGGFGGGGAAGFTGGGGGGYSGGGAGRINSPATAGAGVGGGGGSYNSGTAQTNTAATRIGNGLVIFTY